MFLRDRFARFASISFSRNEIPTSTKRHRAIKFRWAHSGSRLCNETKHEERKAFVSKQLVYTCVSFRVSRYVQYLLKKYDQGSWYKVREKLRELILLTFRCEIVLNVIRISSVIFVVTKDAYHVSFRRGSLNLQMKWRDVTTLSFCYIVIR